MLFPEVLRAIVFLLASSLSILACRQWSIWRVPTVHPVSFAFVTNESAWEPPDTKSQRIVMRIPVTVSPQVAMPVEVDFECEFSTSVPDFILEGLNDQRFYLDGNADKPIATGTLTIPPWSDRGWVHLSADIGGLVNPCELELRLKPTQNVVLQTDALHRLSVLPKFQWKTELLVGEAIVSSSMDVDKQPVTLRIIANRAFNKPVSFELAVLPENGNGGRKSFTLSSGEKELDLSAGLNEFIPKDASGRVDVRISGRTVSGTPKLDQKFLLYPTLPPAKLEQLKLTLPAGLGELREGRGLVMLNLEAVFTPGKPSNSVVALQLQGGATSTPTVAFEASSLTISSINPRASIPLRILDNEIPDPVRRVSLQAVSDSVQSNVLSFDLRDDDPLRIQWKTDGRTELVEGATEVATQPAWTVGVISDQVLPEGGYTFDVQIMPRLTIPGDGKTPKARLAIRPSRIHLSNTKKQATFNLFINDDKDFQEPVNVKINLVLSGSAKPDAGIEIEPLTFRLVDNDARPMPPGPEPIKSGKIGVLVIYTDHLKDRWSTKQVVLEELVKKVGKENLAGRGLTFVGDTSQFQWQGGEPPPVASKRYDSYESLIARVNQVCSQVAETSEIEHLVVLWYEKEPPSNDSPSEPVVIDNKIRHHYFWLDGDYASPWFFDHYNTSYKKVWNDGRAIEYFPDSIKQADFVERILTLKKQVEDEADGSK